MIDRYAAVLVVFVSGNLANSSNPSNPSVQQDHPSSTSLVTITTSMLRTVLTTATITSLTAATSSPSPAPRGGLTTSNKLAIGLAVGLGFPTMLVATVT